MKETIISGVIFLSFALLCFFSIRHTESVANTLTDIIVECEKQIVSEAWDLADVETKKAREFFIQKTRALETYLLHDDVERLSDLLSNIETSVMMKEKSSAISSIRIFKRRLLELAEEDKPTYNNIF